MKAEPGHGSYRRQGLAPKPQGSDGREASRIEELRSGVPLQGEASVLGIHPTSVVGYPNEGKASILDVDGH